MYRNNTLSIALVFTGVIAFLSLSKIGAYTPKIDVNFIDKYEHIIAYTALTLSWLFAVLRLEKKESTNYWVVFYVFLFGVLMELLQQTITTYRQADVFDVVANSSGILLGYTLFKKGVSKKFKFFLKAS